MLELSFNGCTSTVSCVVITRPKGLEIVVRMLGGPWIVISGVISRITIAIAHMRDL